MIGPPLTCPLPDGAGFRVLLKDEDNNAIYCDSEKKPCPKHYECIQTIGQFSSEWSGVCCPRKGYYLFYLKRTFYNPFFQRYRVHQMMVWILIKMDG